MYSLRIRSTHILGDMRSRFARLLNSMLCASEFFRGSRSSASFFSCSLRYLTLVDSGRSGNVNYHVVSVGVMELDNKNWLTKPTRATGIPMRPSVQQESAYVSKGR